MGKQMVRCPRDSCVAAVSAMIHLLSGAAWIMAVLPCHVSMVPTPLTPYKIRDGQKLPVRLTREGFSTMQGEAVEQVGRQVPQGQQLLLQRGQGREVDAHLPRHLHHTQTDP